MIYEHVVDSETHTEITRENIRVQSSLLKTCSLMRQEATPIYYKQTRFLITLDPDMKLEVDEWLHVIGPSNAALISNLVVKLCIGSGFISLVLKLPLDDDITTAAHTATHSSRGALKMASVCD